MNFLSKISERHIEPLKDPKATKDFFAYFYTHKKQIINAIYSPSSSTEQTKFWQQLSDYSNKNFSSDESKELLSILNYHGESKVMREFPRAIEHAYLKLLNILSESCEYVGHEKEVIHLIAEILLETRKNLYLFEFPQQNYLPLVNKNRG